jgi:hypothetical protein
MYMRETLKHQQAFEYYYMLGPERSLGKVASQFGISRPTATMWSQKLGWDQRIIERDNKNMQAIRERNDEDVISNMESYRKIIKASVGDYIKRLKDGKVKIDTVRDFTQLVKLDMELSGYVAQIEKEQKIEAENNNNEVVFTINDEG